MDNIPLPNFYFNYVDDEPETATEKTCTGCGLLLPLDDFHRNARKRGGRRAQCKVCSQAQHKAAYARNPGPSKARAKKRREEKPEEIKARLKEHYEKNHARIRAEQKEYRYKNRERILAWYWGGGHREAKLAYDKERRRLYPEKVKISSKRSSHMRRARMRAAQGSWTAAEWRALCEKYGHTCLRCRQQFEFIDITFDHVIPISRGGRNDIQNAQPLCHVCNAKKGVQIIDYR